MTWKLPFETMRQVANDAAAAWQPELPNAIRVRKTGGTLNYAGERVGETEERVDLRLAVFRVKKREKKNMAGPRATATHTAITAEEDLRESDLVEWRGIQLRVIAMDRPELDGEKAFFRAHLKQVG